jgi:CheY-like chemotaxis protein
VTTCAQILRPLLAGVDVRTALTESLPSIRARPGQILHLILSLAAYARNVMPGGGRLTLATALAEPVASRGAQAAGSNDTLVDESHAGEATSALPAARPPHSTDMREVVLSVSDSSPGMDEMTRSHLCEQLASCTNGSGGVGLGVASAAEVVKQMSGRMGISSSPGQGTTFTVFLPAALTGPPGASRWRGDETILVAEDTGEVRKLMERVLTSNGYRVLTAADGEEALAIAEQLGRPIDLLVADIGLPRRNGKEVAAGVRMLCDTLRVLYISGYPQEPSPADAQATAEFLQKPFNPEALLRKVREMLGPPAGR